MALRHSGTGEWLPERFMGSVTLVALLALCVSVANLLLNILRPYPTEWLEKQCGVGPVLSRIVSLGSCTLIIAIAAAMLWLNDSTLYIVGLALIAVPVFMMWVVGIRYARKAKEESPPLPNSARVVYDEGYVEYHAYISRTVLAFSPVVEQYVTELQKELFPETLKIQDFHRHRFSELGKLADEMLAMPLGAFGLTDHGVWREHVALVHGIRNQIARVVRALRRRFWVSSDRAMKEAMREASVLLNLTITAQNRLVNPEKYRS